jgi:hypothetical protein
MHRHECNTRNNLFDLENQTKDFSYTIFPVKKTNVGKNFKIMRKLLFNYSLYIHILKLGISGCDTVRPPPPGNQEIL